MKKALFITSILVLLNGCGGGGGSSPNAVESYSTSLDMVQNEEYVIEEGNTIVKESSDTVVELNIDRESGETVAILRSGKAHIE